MKGTVDFNGWIRVDVILSGAAGRVLDIITETLLLALGINGYGAASRRNPRDRVFLYCYSFRDSRNVVSILNLTGQLLE